MQSKFSIDIVPPNAWKTKEAAVEFVLTDQTGAGFEKVEVKIEKNGNWQDVTDSLVQKENKYFGQVEIAKTVQFMSVLPARTKRCMRNRGILNVLTALPQPSEREFQENFCTCRQRMNCQE